MDIHFVSALFTISKCVREHPRPCLFVLMLCMSNWTLSCQGWGLIRLWIRWRKKCLGKGWDILHSAHSRQVWNAQGPLPLWCLLRPEILSHEGTTPDVVWRKCHMSLLWPFVRASLCPLLPPGGLSPASQEATLYLGAHGDLEPSSQCAVCHVVEANMCSEKSTEEDTPWMLHGSQPLASGCCRP